jgi:hypothetical protein
MESNKLDESGNMIVEASLNLSGTPIKTIHKYKVLEVPEEGNLPKFPFYLKSEVGFTVPIAKYANVVGHIGINAPVNLSEIEIKEAYKELRAIVMDEAEDIINEMSEAVLKRMWKE